MQKGREKANKLLSLLSSSSYLMILAATESNAKHNVR